MASSEPGKSISAVSVRLAGPSDMEEAAESFRKVASERVYLGTETVPEGTASRWEERWQDNGEKNLFAVALIEGKIVGGLVLTPLFSPKSNHVRNLGMWVLLDHRGAGVGKSLISFAKEWAKGVGVKRIMLEVYATNLAAINLYLRAGFTFEGCFKGNALINGEYVDELSMAMEL